MMRQLEGASILAFTLLLSVTSTVALGQAASAQGAGQPATAQPSTELATLSCVSTGSGNRVHCPADTSAGVLMRRSIGSSECLLGRTWGYDQQGVWVTDGCGAEFAVASAPSAEAAPPAPAPAEGEPAEEPVDPTVTPTPAPDPARVPTPRIETWGEFDPGDGFLIGRTEKGEFSISGYGLFRYINQMPTGQTFIDHLGNERPVDAREDLFPHRGIVFFKGWLGNPKFIYTIILWTVNTTDQDAVFPVLGYQFSRKFSLYAGINGNPGTRSMQGSHPYWLGSDRVMADEFFRPFFSFGTWASGEIVPGLWYNAMVANNSSSLGVTAVQLDRDLTTGFSVWWMPTTDEFGPKGAYGDWEWHEDLATRFGFSTVSSPENRQTGSFEGPASNTVIKLADSLNVFDLGSLAPGVTVGEVDYQILSVDIGFKYRGIFVQTEIYNRWLDGFVADGPLPVDEIHDRGFYVQAAFYPIRHKLELYAATSQIYGDEDAGFSDSSEYLGGLNWYFTDVRNHRLNFQLMDVNHSPVSSTFGYYVGGQDGTTVSTGVSFIF